MPFEHPYGAALTGTIAVSVADPAVGAYPPATIVQRDHAWQINVNWTINGPAALGLGGDWTVRAFLESVGPGYEGQAGPTMTVPVSAAPPAFTRAYSTTISVPAAITIPGFTEGAYWLTILINYSNGGVPGEIAGVEELPIMQFYTAT